MGGSIVPRSLVYATEIDVLGPDREVERRGDHLVVRSPSNPAFYWGNFLLFDTAPRSGDGERWEQLFEEAFGDEPRVRHRAFGWDETDGSLGAAPEAFGARGYVVEGSVGLVAEAGGLTPHPRENQAVEIRTLDPDADEDLWDGVIALQVASRDPVHEEASHRDFSRARNAELRTLFRAGSGAWYVALDPPTGAVVGSCGIVVTYGRGRFQSVDTATAHRRKGICSRLVVEAASRSERDFGTERFVIVADPEYHAVGLYESLGFDRRERSAGAYRRPPSARSEA
jgi:ribosomal protein S18 acetylase RimI-like enzyme